MSLTPLHTLGEFALIERLKRTVQSSQTSTLCGIGDDAAVLHPLPNEKIVCSTDLLLEGVHFDLRYFPLKHLGYKTVIAGISDILAMNAVPRQMLLAVGVSSKFSLEALEEFYAGVHLACEKYHIDWVGGDTSPSRTGLTLCVTAIGSAKAAQIVYRNTAAVGDLIVVSGDLGAAYMGLQVLEREKKLYLENPTVQPDLQGNEYILERQLKPEARLAAIEWLQKMEIQPTAMIDISDGLASDVLQITHASGVGCRIYDEKLPISSHTRKAAEDFHLHPSTCALNGGEDYELLFTIHPKDYERLSQNLADAPIIFTVIGHITEHHNVLVMENGETLPLQAQGWGITS